MTIPETMSTSWFRLFCELIFFFSIFTAIAFFNFEILNFEIIILFRMVNEEILFLKKFELRFGLTPVQVVPK